MAPPGGAECLPSSALGHILVRIAFFFFFLPFSRASLSEKFTRAEMEGEQHHVSEVAPESCMDL